MALTESLSIRGQERVLCIGTPSTEHLIAMRETSKARDNIAVAVPASYAALNIGMPQAGRRLQQPIQQLDALVLLFDLLGVMERMV